MGQYLLTNDIIIPHADFIFAFVKYHDFRQEQDVAHTLLLKPVYAKIAHHRHSRSFQYLPTISKMLLTNADLKKQIVKEIMAKKKCMAIHSRD